MARGKFSLFAVTMACLVLLIPGCSTKIVATVYTSSPEVQQTVTENYDIVFVPQKDGNTFYSFFKLQVTNKTDNDFEIDWNRTRYTHEGKPRGSFIFQEITPADVKNSTVPNDAVPAQGSLTRWIAPHQLVARAPNRDLSVQAGQSGISGGMLPGGENGISLVLVKGGQVVREQLSVTINSQSAAQ